MYIPISIHFLICDVEVDGFMGCDPKTLYMLDYYGTESFGVELIDC